jgi:hypothetical protein
MDLESNPGLQGENSDQLTLISGFHHSVDEICTLLGYHTASGGNCSPTFWDKILVPSSRVPVKGLTLEDGINTSSQNISKQLPDDAT